MRGWNKGGTTAMAYIVGTSKLASSKEDGIKVVSSKRVDKMRVVMKSTMGTVSTIILMTSKREG